MSARTLDWTVTAREGFPLPVLDGQITVDRTRNPQVSASVTVPFTDWATAKAFDMFTRAPVWLEIRHHEAITGALRDFAKSSPGVLSALDWSNKAAPPSTLGPASPTLTTRRIRLYTTEAIIDEIAGTVTVQLASADYLLMELHNFGQPWLPRPSSINVDRPFYYVNQVFHEFCRVFGIPLFDRFGGITGIGGLYEVDPWPTGANAWSWLNGARVLSGSRYILDTVSGALTFTSMAWSALAAGVIDRGLATAITSRRSVENAGEGLNLYADAWASHWTDPTDANRPEQWEFATKPADWRTMRRAFVEERSMESWGPVLGRAEGLLSYRDGFRRVTTVTIPLDPIAMPFRDFTDHPYADSVQTIVYDYPSGDVTTTYLEAD